MANKEKLPWDMVEEILSRVPPTSLVRFRTVCKRWNTLFDDKTFINNHKMTFQFILTTTSKIYSVSVKPKVEVRELTLNTPGLKAQIPEFLADTSGFLLCDVGDGAVVWNPWLRQTRCIEPEVNQPSLDFVGIGYDNNNKRVEEIVYKTLSVYMKDLGSSDTWKIHDFASDTWKDEDLDEAKYNVTINYYLTSVVSLNGTLYWVAYNDDKTHDTDPFLFYLLSFNFSSEEFLKFCDLPSGKNHACDALVVRVFREDRFSLLKQCHVTKKIKIWVTKNKIDNRYGGDVKWMSFMEVSIPNMPDLVQTKFYYQPSYFIDDKRLVICSCDETGRAWIYVVGENKLINKVRLDSVADPWPLHCTYFPNLVLIPGRSSKPLACNLSWPRMRL
ncbi:F-box associated domain type 1 [Arabidopsis thaliana x Arabidopsis arenosa]|uniref:F-box associated domain type 1 n=1 Tax=Arabidopsis thaliana x Arabidopsis arenosa TaxID=1240361 RepID=A0A8T2C0V3_9BRAS|nr:F-box associated domain type 1 [Arabidopsis thaliana x Arabidopsis arenosa]